MASFTITGYSTSPQTITTGETGFVGPDGVIYTAGDTAISVIGTVQILILGQVASMTTNAIVADTSGSVSLQIGDGGHVVSGLGIAVSTAVGTRSDVTNAGTIQAGATAVQLYELDGAAPVQLANSGSITSQQGSAAFLDSGGASARLTNTGTMTTLGSTVCVQMKGFNVLLGNFGIITSPGVGVDIELDAGGSAFVRNFGTIDGGLDVRGPGSLVLKNRGVIVGAVFGTDGNDTFDNVGGQVYGKLVGGAGDDSYILDSSTIEIIDSSGTDYVTASVDFVLGSGLEGLILTGAPDLRGRGNELANEMYDNAGNSTLYGGAGTDLLFADSGDDRFFGGSSRDILRAGLGSDNFDGGAGRDEVSFELVGDSGAVKVDLAAGTASGPNDMAMKLVSVEDARTGAYADTVSGSAVANRLEGGAGNDRIAGLAGNDTLVGGTGRDSLEGGAGRDRFVLAAADQSPAGSGRDRILGFEQGNDRIDLSLIDPVAGGGNDTFTFLGSGALLAGGLRFGAVSGNTLVEGDVTGDGVADFQILLTGLFTLTGADFVL
jgi:Ca2+-binding RTX toxin-like protein